MKLSVEKILRNHYVDGVFHTHVSMVQPRGKFQFNRKELENFWDVYCDKMLKENKTSIFGVAEKPQHYLPVLADIDLKMNDTESDVEYGEHLYSEDQVSEVIGAYQSVLRTIVDQCTDTDLLCILLEKPLYYIDGSKGTTWVKNGFHLHFPNLFLSKVDQEVHLIPRVQEILRDLDVFGNLKYEDSGKVVDKACCKVPWLMYGSRKSEDMDPYEVTRLYSSDGSELDLEEGLSGYKLYDSEEKLLDMGGRIREYLPRILSIIPYGRKTSEVREGLQCPSVCLGPAEKKSVGVRGVTKLSVRDALNLAKELLPMLAQWRAEDRNEWMTIGWILYNVGEGSSEALNLWLEFSERGGDSYEEATCIYEWKRMIRKDLSLGTLRYYAGMDSPQEYKEFRKKQSEHYVKESLNGSHNDIAKVLHSEYGEEFVCGSISNKTWYQFRDHRWEEIEEGVFLRARISSEIVTKYSDIGKEIFTQLAQVQDKAEEAMYNARLVQVKKIISNLKSSPYKNNIMKEAMEVFYDRRFKTRLNQNPYLIGFKNGVYDLKLCKFRDGIPEDFLSKCVPIEYNEYSESDEEVQNVIEFLQKVFPDKSIRNYFLDVYSDIFVGGNSQKKVYLWTGEGDNGKSITQSFFEKMLGELAIKFNTQYFTGKKTSSGSANPELARAAPPVRHATMEEPDADEQLNIGELKKLSGGDSYWARDLFEKGKNTREVFPMFTLTFICNKLPKLKHSDKATWNRLRVIPFESTFVDSSQECPTTLEEQLLAKRFPMDKTFSQKIPGMVGAFAWYLLQWRQNVTIRIEPQKVREATEVYLKAK